MFKLLVLATTNQNKVREFRQFVSEFPVTVKSLSDFGPLPGVIEDGSTFDANAYKKAHHYAKVLGIPALADDSGLVVEALSGAPGVRSARYAGDNVSDQDNCRKLLTEMEGQSNRKASFVCVLSIAVPSGPALTYEASCEGTILDAPRGSNGFGYDPLFYYEPYGKTFAEISMDEKNKVSHRGKVLSELSGEFDKVLKWLEQRTLEEMPEQPDHSEFENNDWSR
ncbi:MAG: XTP/dITP diphosphatase [Desulfofustis sp.]|nr:XTP/dITP diphosphatase [Desulfofustis sp.]NNF46125.1 XTP/dITP diphosphatase [Desulfofustis sp.]NNK56593.1 XTP/dITP diphosphatase [Desulfofustis sp.]RZW19190.1 MAG: XTP/dITP diphosphatase [Desulfobulbaceae bacterium]